MSVSIELAYITHVLSRNEVERCNCYRIQDL
jgi:hypothetical protein